MLSDEWLSRYGLLENFNASVTRTGTGTGTYTGTGTWTTGVTAIALCTSCSRAKKQYSGKQIFSHRARVFFFCEICRFSLHYKVNNYPVTKNKTDLSRSDHKQMKGLAESSPFHLLTNLHMINRFIFGHWYAI